MEGRRRRQSRRPEARGWLRSGGKRERGSREVDSRPQLGRRRPELAWPRRGAAASGGGHEAALQRLLSVRIRGEKGMRSSGTLLPTSARAAVLRNGGSAVACARGGGNGGSGERRRRCRAEERAWGGGAAGGGGCEAQGLRGPFYRRPLL